MHPQQDNKVSEAFMKIRENLFLQSAKIFAPVANFVAKPWRKAVPGEHVDHVAVKRSRSIQVVAVIAILLIGSITFSLLTGSSNKNKEKVNLLVVSATQNLN